MKKIPKKTASGKPAGFRSLCPAPGWYWQALCRDLKIEPDKWARPFGLTGDEMHEKMNAEIATVYTPEERPDGSINQNPHYERASFPEAIWDAYGELIKAHEESSQ